MMCDMRWYGVVGVSRDQYVCMLMQYTYNLFIYVCLSVFNVDDVVGEYCHDCVLRVGNHCANDRAGRERRGRARSDETIHPKKVFIIYSK